MSRKRKRLSEDLESAAKPNHETEANGIVDDPAPPPQPLEFSIETLKQIHTACSTSIPVQKPLLEAFRLFERCITSTDWSSSNANRDIMTTYFEQNNEFLPTMVNLWGVSWEQNFLALAFQIPNTLSLLLESLSTSSHLSNSATMLVNTVFDQQLKSIYRILASERGGPKNAAIALLTKIASLPKSSSADMIYRLVVSGFNVWPKLLSQKGSMREKEIAQAAKMRKLNKREASRSYAIDLFLALLKSGSLATKENLLGNRLLTSPLIKFLPLDPNETILALLDTLTIHVLSDKKIPRSVKTGFFNTEQFLYKIARIHSREFDHPHDTLNILGALEQFLLDACTTFGNGICFEDRGWYPRPDATLHDPDSQIHNLILLRFILQLLPLESPFERTLTLKILETCAELRAPYLSKTKAPVEPNMTFSFISTTSFWQDIINLPSPNPFNEASDLPEEPPPAVTIVENLLPTFVTKQYLTAALNNSSALVRFTSAQLLLTSLMKLKTLQRVFLSGGARWQAFSDVVLEKIARRLPDSGSVVTLYSTSSGHRLLSISGIKLMSLYNELLWSVDHIRKIDAKALSAPLQKDWSFTDPVEILQHIHMLQILEDQSDFNWWSKQGTNRSLLAALLEKRFLSPHHFAGRQIDMALENLVRRSNAFQSTTVIRPLQQLCLALEDTVENLGSVQSVEVVIDFVEESFMRFMGPQQLYSFYDEIAALVPKGKSVDNLSCILVTFARQWEHKHRREKDEHHAVVTEWLCNFLFRLVIIGENADAILTLVSSMGKVGTRTVDLVRLQDDIRYWTQIANSRNQDVSRSPSRGRKWSLSQDELVSKTLTGLHMETVATNGTAIAEVPRSDRTRLSSYEILRIFRQLIRLHSRVESASHYSGDGDIARCFSLLLEAMTVLEKSDLEEFQMSRRAIVQVFCGLAQWSEGASLELSNIVSNFSSIVEKFYEPDDPDVLGTSLIMICNRIPDMADTSLPHLTIVLEQLTLFWPEQERSAIISSLFEQFSSISCIGPRASYMASCIESLLRPSRLTWSRLTAGYLEMLFRIGYEVQSEFIGDVIEEWLNERADSVPDFINGVVSCDFIWKSTLFSRFEMRILARLAFNSHDVLRRLKQKLATCEAELQSLNNVLQFAVYIGGNHQDMRYREIQPEMDTYLNRCGTFVEGLFKKDGVSAEIWDIVPYFVSMAKDIDLGKWLGMICKRDSEHINPQGCRAIRSVLDKDPQAYHRSLPGWIVRTFSRFTRRFSEDKELSEVTLRSLNDFKSLIVSLKENEEIKHMVESKPSYVETVMLAAITHHLHSVDVSSLVVTLLSTLKLSSEYFNEASLLQSVLGQKHRFEEASEPKPRLQLQMNIVNIIYHLFMMNPPRNSTESVLIGILGHYTASVRPADSLLRDVLRRIDSERSLNVLSSAETWNAFRASWSRSHLEAIASSLQSPFALIESESMQHNVLHLRVSISTSKANDEMSLVNAAGVQLDDRLLDPFFWLPIVAYCLDKITHSSELTFLIENSAIGYALVCLSSNDLTIRRMAAFILVSWEHLCQDYNLRERNQIKVLMNALRNSGQEENGISRLPKLITVFLAESLRVIMDPKHILYEKVNSFFLQRPTLDLGDIPMFYTLSNSGEHFESEVMWLFNVMNAGLDDPLVSTAFSRRHVVEFCLGLYRSRTGRFKTGKSRLPKAIIKFLSKMFEQENFSELLISKYGLGAWLQQEVAFGDCLDVDTTEAVGLWKTRILESDN